MGLDPSWLLQNLLHCRWADSGSGDSPSIVLTIAARLKRTGMEMKLVLDGAPQTGPADASLLRVLVRAHGLRDRVVQDGGCTLEEMAKQEGVSPSYVTRLLRLTFLAPDIVTAILNGAHPSGLTANKLMGDTRLPLEWSEQRRVLGFA